VRGLGDEGGEREAVRDANRLALRRAGPLTRPTAARSADLSPRGGERDTQNDGAAVLSIGGGTLSVRSAIWALILAISSRVGTRRP